MQTVIHDRQIIDRWIDKGREGGGGGVEVKSRPEWWLKRRTGRKRADYFPFIILTADPVAGLGTSPHPPLLLIFPLPKLFTHFHSFFCCPPFPTSVPRGVGCTHMTVFFSTSPPLPPLLFSLPFSTFPLIAETSGIKEYMIF